MNLLDIRKRDKAFIVEVKKDEKVDIALAQIKEKVLGSFLFLADIFYALFGMRDEVITAKSGNEALSVHCL